MNTLNNNNSNHDGFVILFTILIAAIIMVIGLGMYSIATRESVLSGTAREAQYAFYAADAGIECVLYAQSLDNASGGNTPLIIEDQSNQSFACGNLPVILISGIGDFSNPYVYRVMIDQVKRTCAQVSIFNTGTITNPNLRRVIAQGYNLCDPNTATPITSSPLLVERNLDIIYNASGGTPVPPSATSTPVGP